LICKEDDISDYSLLHNTANTQSDISVWCFVCVGVHRLMLCCCEIWLLLIISVLIMVYKYILSSLYMAIISKGENKMF